MDPKGDNRRPDHLVVKIAARQHGVIAIAELLFAGLTPTRVPRLAIKAPPSSTPS